MPVDLAHPLHNPQLNNPVSCCPHPKPPPCPPVTGVLQGGFPVLSGVDKQAMVEDWLNPEGEGEPPFPGAPQVQQADAATTDAAAALQKLSKVGFLLPLLP